LSIQLGVNYKIRTSKKTQKELDSPKRHGKEVAFDLLYTRDGYNPAEHSTRRYRTELIRAFLNDVSEW
jgi:hypothetical protein